MSDLLDLLLEADELEDREENRIELSHEDPAERVAHHRGAIADDEDHIAALKRDIEFEKDDLKEMLLEGKLKDEDKREKAKHHLDAIKDDKDHIEALKKDMEHEKKDLKEALMEMLLEKESHGKKKRDDDKGAEKRSKEHKVMVKFGAKIADAVEHDEHEKAKRLIAAQDKVLEKIRGKMFDCKRD